MSAEFVRDAAGTAAILGFFAWLLHYPLIHVVGVLVTLVALAAIPWARSRTSPVSAVTGLATGTVLLAAALFSMTGVLLWP